MELAISERTFGLEESQHDTIEVQDIFVKEVQDISDTLVLFKKSLKLLELGKAVPNIHSHLHDFVKACDIVS